jgi:hypothetical protein
MFGCVESVVLTRQAYRFALDPTVEQEALLASFAGRRGSGSTRVSRW